MRREIEKKFFESIQNKGSWIYKRTKIFETLNQFQNGIITLGSK